MSIDYLKTLLLLDQKDISRYFTIQPASGSGPGGQKKNRTFSGVRLIDPILGFTVIITTHREKDRNLAEALQNLKFLAAIQFELTDLDYTKSLFSPFLLPKKISSENKKVAFYFFQCKILLLEAMGDLNPVATHTGYTKSQLLKFLYQDKRSWQWLMQYRHTLGLPSLFPPR